jgi:hypothetical protein
MRVVTKAQLPAFDVRERGFLECEQRRQRLVVLVIEGRVCVDELGVRRLQTGSRSPALLRRERA